MQTNIIQLAPVIAMTTVTFIGSVPVPSSLDGAQSPKTLSTHYQATEEISWTTHAVFDTVTGTPGFVIAKVNPATEYGKADQLDIDDYIHYE